MLIFCSQKKAPDIGCYFVSETDGTQLIVRNHPDQALRIHDVPAISLGDIRSAGIKEPEQGESIANHNRLVLSLKSGARIKFRKAVRENENIQLRFTEAVKENLAKDPVLSSDLTKSEAEKGPGRYWRAVAEIENRTMPDQGVVFVFHADTAYYAKVQHYNGLWLNKGDIEVQFGSVQELNRCFGDLKARIKSRNRTGTALGVLILIVGCGIFGAILSLFGGGFMWLESVGTAFKKGFKIPMVLHKELKQKYLSKYGK